MHPHGKILAGLSVALCLAALPASPGDDARSIGGGKCSENAYNCVGAANPLPPASTLWLEHMTWMDVRDAIAGGKTTVIVPAGGMDPNGPWAALDKHDRIVATMCESIARSLGDALCAPVIPFVPEGGGASPPDGFANTPGALYISEPAYEALLADIATGLKGHGFRSIVMIGDHGGDVAGMQAVAARLAGEWHGAPAVAYIPEFYQSYDGAVDLLYQKGLGKRGVVDGLHDDPTVTLMMMLSDPESVRWQERVALGKASIDGVSIADRAQAQAWGRDLVEYRTRVTVEAIHKALAPAKVMPAAAAAAQIATGHPSFTLLDVRTPEEFAAGHVPGARNIPVQQLEARIGEIADLRDQPLVVYCRTGHRAGIALGLLGTRGYTQLSHLEGDMQGWTEAGREVEQAPAGGGAEKH